MIQNEIIEKIKTELSIVDIVSPYTKLTPRGKSLVGKCPLCGSNKTFSVSPYKNMCKCFACGAGGSSINFIKYFENLDFKQAIDFILTKFVNTLKIENIYGDLLRGSVYVLKLENNCYYIGFSTNIDKRIEDHFNGNGALWTRKNKPLSVLKIYDEKTLNFENYLTEKAIKKVGYNYVRGGDHLYFHKKYGKPSKPKLRMEP